MDYLRGLTEYEVQTLIECLSTLHTLGYFDKQLAYEKEKIVSQFASISDDALPSMVRRHQGAAEVLGRLRGEAANAHTTLLSQIGDSDA